MLNTLKLFVPSTMALITMASCLSAPPDSEVTATGEEKAAPQVLPVMLACAPDFAASRILPSEMVIEGNILKAQLMHSGGCGAHKFTACYIGAPIEAWPDDATGGEVLVSQIGIQHITNDHCEALLATDVEIDLASLAARYRAEHGDAGELLTVDIGGGLDTLTTEFIISEASNFEAGLLEAAHGAVYATEIDASPRYVEAANIGTSNPTVRKVRSQFGIAPAQPVKAFSRPAALAWLEARLEATEGDDASDEAWLRLSAYVQATLGKSLRMYRIGPVQYSLDSEPEFDHFIYLFVGKDPADPTRLAGFSVTTIN